MYFFSFVECHLNCMWRAEVELRLPSEKELLLTSPSSRKCSAKSRGNFSRSDEVSYEFGGAYGGFYLPGWLVDKDDPLGLRGDVEIFHPWSLHGEKCSGRFRVLGDILPRAREERGERDGSEKGGERRGGKSLFGLGRDRRNCQMLFFCWQIRKRAVAPSTTYPTRKGSENTFFVNSVIRMSSAASRILEKMLSEPIELFSLAVFCEFSGINSIQTRLRLFVLRAMPSSIVSCHVIRGKVRGHKSG